MRKLLLIHILMMLSMICFANIEKYYIGSLEISKADYYALDTTLLRTKEIWTSNDTVRYIVEPDVYSRIDSISVPGKVSVVRKSDKEISVIDSILSANRTGAAILKVGDTIPDFIFYSFMFPERGLNYKELLRGKIVLINFWATWCGPCVEELKPEHLPALLDEFKKNDNFVFLPVSVNHSRQELTEFFQSSRGKELGWIEHETVWDRNGEFSNSLSTGGIPLMILIDADGIIRLNEAGAFLNEIQKSKLKNSIEELLD